MQIRKLPLALILATAVLAPAGAVAGFHPIAEIRAAHERHVAKIKQVHGKVRNRIDQRHAVHRERAARVHPALARRVDTHQRRLHRAQAFADERHAAHADFVHFRSDVHAAPVRTASEWPRRHPLFAAPGEGHATLADWVRARHAARVNFLEQHRIG